MKKDWKYISALVLMVVVVGAIFSVGIFNNPDFTIQEFCMGLSTEIVGVVIVLVVFDRYANIKTKHREERQAQKDSDTEKSK